MTQPHWVYIATFADAHSKVGTATDLRKKSRLDEQGAIMATYIARSITGQPAREIEDAITAGVAVTQTRRRAAKVAALASPSTWESIAAAHAATVDRALDLVKHTSAGNRAITPVREPWEAPPDIHRFMEPTQPGGWTIYPHDLSTGEHGLIIDACVGQTVLARTRSDDDEISYVVDLGQLKGSRILAGHYSSPQSVIQNALF